MLEHQTARPGHRIGPGTILALAVLAAAMLVLAAGMMYDGAGDAVSATVVTADVVDRALEGRRIRVSGRLESGESLRDPVLGVSAGAVALIREVEMYQWQETFPTAGLRRSRGIPESAGDPRYRAAWHARRIASERFRDADIYRNPREWPLRAATWRAREPRLGAFRLDPALLDPSAGAMRQQRPLISAPLDGLPPALRARATNRQPDWLYIGDPLMPEIGDLRVRVYALPAQQVTVTGIQRGDRLVAAPAGTGLEWHASGADGPSRRLAAASPGWLAAAALAVALVVGMLRARRRAVAALPASGPSTPGRRVPRR